ncbi:hypothetical protein GGR50DRAFT_684036 [Xylaria sp. CBS 124048]|nr:hypothetical protein GGR50DRAFT_684036 [Xylaria sp. CBS 124048]
MPRFITDDRQVDKTNPVEIKVICAGPPRAATSSMQAAMERLGFGPCMHMAHMLPHAERTQLMLNAVREQDREKRHEMIRELMAGHASVADFPVIFFAADLMDMYPEAAIVLNQRKSAEQWTASAKESFEFFFSWRFPLVCMLFRTERLWYALNVETMRMFDRLYGNPAPWTVDAYEGHRRWVLDEARKRGRRVLEFVPEEGWGPLCHFLDAEVPDEAFPRLNEKETFRTIRRIFIAKGLLGWLALGGSVWAGWKFGPIGVRFLRDVLRSYVSV